MLVDLPATALVDTPQCRTADGDLRDPVTEPVADALLRGGPSCLVRAVQQLSGLRVDHLLDVDLGRDGGAVSPACPTDALPDVDLGMLVNPVGAASVLLAAADAVTLDEDTTLADLRSLAATLRDLPADAVERAALPVSRVGHVPAGGSTAQVLLDGAGTRDLFDSVIRTGALPGAEDATAAATVPTTDGERHQRDRRPRLGSRCRCSTPPAAPTRRPARAPPPPRRSPSRASSSARSPRSRPRSATSVVRHAPEAVEQARTVAAAVPGAVLEPSDAVGGRRAARRRPRTSPCSRWPSAPPSPRPRPRRPHRRRHLRLNRRDGSGTSGLDSAEAAGDVVLGGLLVGVAEDLLGRVELDQPTGLAHPVEVEEAGLLADAGGLLHVVRDDDDGEAVLELGHQVLDGQRGDRVQRGAGLVHEQHVGLDGDRPGDAQPLLLTAGQAGARAGPAGP